MKEPYRFLLQRFGNKVTKTLRINWVQLLALIGRSPIISEPAAIMIATTAVVFACSMIDNAFKFILPTLFIKEERFVISINFPTHVFMTFKPFLPHSELFFW